MELRAENLILDHHGRFTPPQLDALASIQPGVFVETEAPPT